MFVVSGNNSCIDLKYQINYMFVLLMWKKHSKASPHRKSTSIKMGIFDFLNKREGDFIPLKSDNDKPYGPGPLILMYAVPSSIDDEELRDMVEDGLTNSNDVVIRRIDDGNLEDNESRGNDDLLDLSVQDAFNLVMKEGGGMKPRRDTNNDASNSVTSPKQYSENDPCPVLYFSGVANSEMMNTYRIIANEIYEETNGVHWPACAMVVEPAMQKSLRQVLVEISSDHADAMRLRRESMKQSE